MSTNGDDRLKWGIKTRRITEIMEMYLFYEGAPLEETLCGADAPAVSKRSVGGYLEDRLHGHWVGTVCEACKVAAIPFAVNLDCGPIVEGSWDEAHEYHELAKTLAGETGQNPPDS